MHAYKTSAETEYLNDIERAKKLSAVCPSICIQVMWIQEDPAGYSDLLLGIDT